MKKIILLILISNTIFRVAAQVNEIKFSELFLLKGTWGMETTKGILYENWVINNDSTMTGKSYRLNNTDTVLLETVGLVKRGSHILYIASAEGQNNQQAVAFKLMKWDNDTFIFENPEHDFPQRVIYELPKHEKLHAWIEGTINGQSRKSDFHYKKII
ncbi:MAG: DUF6265 family protein [Chitinophagaceae bacterium]